MNSQEQTFFPKHLMKSMSTKEADTNNMTQTIIASLLKYGQLRLGRCIPSVCTAEDVETGLLNFLLEYLNSDELGDWFTSEAAQPVALNCHTKKDKIELNWRDWTFIGALLFFAILLTVGTFIDIILNILHLDWFPEKMIQIYQGFSIYQNILKLFNTDGGSGDSLN